MRLALCVAAASLLLAPAAARAAGELGFSAPVAYGVVELARQLRYELTGDCQAATVRVVARFGETRVLGAPAHGCRGVVSLPAADATPVSLELQAGDAILPLRHRRLQPEDGDMATGDVSRLGRANLAGIYAVYVRSKGEGSWELRAGAPDGTVVAASSLGTPDPVGTVRTERVEGAAPAELVDAPEGPVDLYLAMTEGSGSVNWLDLTGSGVLLPYDRPDPLPGGIALFNGKDLGDWGHIGHGSFTVDGGDMLAVPSSLPITWGWEYYKPKQFSDFRLRLDVKTTAYGDNGGVLLRHNLMPDHLTTYLTATEVQLADAVTQYMGGIDHVQEALRQPQSSPGEWSTVEIVVNGSKILAAINGVVTSRYDERGCGISARLPCHGSADPDSASTRRSGYLSVEDEVGAIRYRDLELYECRGPDDPLCAVDLGADDPGGPRLPPVPAPAAPPPAPLDELP